MSRPKTPVRILILLLGMVAAGSLAYALSNVRKGYEPRQPILFRHSRMAGPAVMQTNEKGEAVNVGGYDIPCLTCHTIGQSGALRFPDLEGIGAKAKTRVPGMSDVEYLAQSLYEPTA